MSVGAQLRASREARGLSIEALAHTTRVQARIIAAIERDDVAGVPPRPFGRGLVRSYAREVGLDGDRITSEYFAQFAAPPPAVADQPAGHTIQLTHESPPAPSRQRPHWVPVMMAAGLTAGVALAVVLARSRPSAPTSTSPGIGTSGTAAGAVASDAAAPPAADTPAAPPAPVAPTPPIATSEKPAAPAAPLSIVLTAERPSWVTADADGRRALYLTLIPGSPQTITASREIVIRVGDAGGLRWQVNGRDVGSMGRAGQVRDITVTPANAASIR